MAPFSRNAGSASAVMGCIQMAIGTLASVAVSVLSNGTALPMTGIMAFCASLSFCFLMAGSKIIIRYRANIEQVEEEAAEMISTS